MQLLSSFFKKAAEKPAFTQLLRSFYAELRLILARANPHATELIFLMSVPANKMGLFGTYIKYYAYCALCTPDYPRLDSILELCLAFPIGDCTVFLKFFLSLD